MQNHTVASSQQGTQQLVRVPAGAGDAAGPASRQPPMELDLSGFKEEMALSYFFGTYGWAPFWRPLLRMATDGSFPDINRTCSLAIAYGYMGLGHHENALLVQGRSLYGRTLREIQVLLNQSTKEQLARLTVTVIMMGMYAVRLPSGDVVMCWKSVGLTPRTVCRRHQCGTSPPRRGEPDHGALRPRELSA